MTHSIRPGAIGALIFERNGEPDSIVAAFVSALRARDVRVGGLLQRRRTGVKRAGIKDVVVEDIGTGTVLDVLQELGPESSGCRVDPNAIASAGQLFTAALVDRPDLLVVNRFGRLESERGGMLNEISAAVEAGVPLLVIVPARYRDAWNAFAQGLDQQIALDRDALDAWWSALSREQSTSLRA